MSGKELVLVERIEDAILSLRRQKVMLDADLASLYGVETRVLVRNVKRSLSRFPADFMFQLTAEEWANLRSQIGISRRWGGRRYPPYAFTEIGIAMLSTVLQSERAVQVNIEIMRTFIRLRAFLADHQELRQRLDILEKKYDAHFRAVFNAIRDVMARTAKSAAPSPQLALPKPSRKIGFKSSGDKS